MNFDYAVSYIIIGLISWIVCYLIVFFLLKQKKWINIVISSLFACVMLLVVGFCLKYLF